MLGFGPISSAPIGAIDSPPSGPVGSGVSTEGGADTSSGSGLTINIGLRTPIIYEPNSDSVVADATGVRVIVRSAIGGTVLLDSSTQAIVSGVCVIDNDLVGNIGDSVDVEMRWTASGQSRFISVPMTVINLFL